MISSLVVLENTNGKKGEDFFFLRKQDRKKKSIYLTVSVNRKEKMAKCCSWCGNERRSNEISYCQSESDERHHLCSSCHLSGHACQSSCPSCWYDLAEKFVEKQNLCSSCFAKFTDDDYQFDSKNHKLCSLCDRCLLCSFRLQTTKEFFRLSYREHDYFVQKILYQMQNCVQQIEYDYELCSICMEFLNDSSPIEILSQCKHRFHQICIEQWFRQKPCCPCCRQSYQIHYQPSETFLFTN